MRHKKVQVVLIQQELKQLFLFQVSKERGSFWQNVTGSVEAGEEIKTAAKRELLEETQIVADTITQLPLSFNFTDRWDKDVTEYCYVATTTKNRVSLSQEHQTSKLVSIQNVPADMFHYPSNYEAFIAALEWVKQQ